jgi:uncharacterized pyridoxal phosphate-dependent enzyme
LRARSARGGLEIQPGEVRVKPAGLRTVINAWGTATPFGVSRSPPEVGAAVAQALGRYCVMQELEQACADLLIAWSGAEAACVTHCTAAAITLAAAACMTGDDAQRLARLPDASGLNRRVLLLAAHDVNYGQRLTQAILLSGAQPMPCASFDEVEQQLLAGGIACVFAVESHLAAGSGAGTTRRLAALCGGRVPLVLDAAAQDQRVRELAGCGADLVLLSAQKYLAAPTAGLVLGKPALVAALAAQHRGIGRGMKPTKEALAGVMAAVRLRLEADPQSAGAMQERKIQCFLAEARNWRGAAAVVERDPQGNDPSRIWLKVDEAAAGLSAAALSTRLRDGAVAIATAPHRLAEGYVGFELHGVSPDELGVLCDAVGRALRSS